MHNNHINLIGDSIIDNFNYVPAPGKTVLGHLDALMPEFGFDQLATDGFTTKDVIKQLAGKELQNGVSVLSVGGNDLLQKIDLLTDESPRLATSLLEDLGEMAEQFAHRYAIILEMIKQPLLVCTIYNPAFFKEPISAPLQEAAVVAVSIFNDHIQRLAKSCGCPVLELRDIFIDESDYANPIEPSDVGGAKLAHEIAIWGWNNGVIYND